MKPILALAAVLATLTTVLSVSASQAQAKQLVFQAGREGESLAWYLLNQRLIAPTPQQQDDRQLYEVTLEVHERYFRQQPRTPGQPPFQGGRPIFVEKDYQTVMWVNCSTQAPFVANESPSKPGYLDVLYINPTANSMIGGTRYYNLYWAVCDEKLDYPSTLTYRSQTVPKQTLLGDGKTEHDRPRYPTEQELHTLIQDFQGKIPQLRNDPGGTYQDRRTVAQRRQQQEFVQVWSKVDRAAAPFLGEWTAIEEAQMIYPSRTLGQVCIIETFIPSFNESGFSFTIGRVVNGRVQADDRKVLVRQAEFLGSVFVYEGKPGLYEYGNPRPLRDPTQVDYLNQEQAIMHQFQTAGCTADLPTAR